MRNTRLALAAVLAAGCGSSLQRADGGPDDGARMSDGGDSSDSRGFVTVVREVLNPKIDILFMVDNSSSMERAQENLRANFAQFMDVLKNLPRGLPDLHIAVVSSDMGAGSNDIPGCNVAGGDNGVFHWGVGASPLNTCTATNLNPDARFISSTGGQNPQANFTGDITQVFQCIAPLGAFGCGFEQQLRSVARALGADGFAPPAENQGFLRNDAYLAIVFITNEDDCSAAQNSFYDVKANTNLASPLGPPGNFRCSEFGHLCDGAKPGRLAPNGLVTDVVNYQNCVSAEDQGQLIRVADVAAGIKALKPDPAGQILVASIQGINASYQIHWKAPAVTTDGPWPDITHSCTGPDGSFADPGVRMQEFVQQFGGNGLAYSICEANFGPALSNFAQKISRFGAACIPDAVVDKDRNPANGVQPDCTVVDIVRTLTDTIEAIIPACGDNGNTLPCWSPRAPDAGECPSGYGHVVQVARSGPAPANGVVAFSCSVCVAGVSDPSAGCP
jgi:hypothetical protein